MTARYVIQQRRTLQFWTGDDGWSPFEGEARSFEFVTDALLSCYAECQSEPQEYEAVPISVRERVSA